MFDGLLHRAARRKAERRYLEGLSWLTPNSRVDELESAREAAAERAGDHLPDRRRAEIDEEVLQRLSIESAQRYGAELAELPLAAVLDGSWREHVDAAAGRWSRWLRPEHQADHHWQAAEVAMRTALDRHEVSDDDLEALDTFLHEIDPEGPQTLDSPWYGRFARARLEAGLLPRPRREPRLLLQDGETAVFTEPGTVLELVEERDKAGQLQSWTNTMEVRVDASDQRLAVFADQLLFTTAWKHVVGVVRDEDDHGPYLQLDDSAVHATHVVHTPMADLLETVARELVRRSGA